MRASSILTIVWAKSMYYAPFLVFTTSWKWDNWFSTILCTTQAKLRKCNTGTTRRYFNLPWGCEDDEELNSTFEERIIIRDPSSESEQQDKSKRQKSCLFCQKKDTLQDSAKVNKVVKPSTRFFKALQK
jgi:hypothetical protein